MNRDPYVYPGTEVLINKLGLHDAKALQEAETGLFLLKCEFFELPAGNFDYAHLKNIHQHFFGDIYEWAGQERTVDIIKGDSHFARKEFIASEINKVFAKLKSENHLKAHDYDTFVKKAADYFSDLNALHPFREGNGRTLRGFFDSLAEQAGYQLDWTQVSKQEYIQANILGFSGNSEAMEHVFRKITTPLGNSLSKIHTQQSNQQQNNISFSISQETKKAFSSYLDKQARLKELIQLKEHNLGTPLAGDYAQQAIALDKEISADAKVIMENPIIQQDVKNNPLERTSFVERGGIGAIKERLEKEQFTAQDFSAVARHIQVKAQGITQTRTQERSRTR